MLDYISVEQASEKWGISKRRIQKLCEEKRIDGVIRFGRSWAIPRDAKKPADARKKRIDVGGENEK
ncbi:helix-turn-helix domain-containing protein [Oscillibacter sp.]|uniref:helix-turn-helix domain-containing protein n=1 Tax=Oscillibacter sp. TaxID=1945593 RepID=UPI0028AE7691|nr:helix-turn-helix domain-containing protein [Oscillibacter sp.]